MNSDAFKQQAALKAMAFVRDGMKLGLGTGSTTEKFVALLGAKVADGLKVQCVPTSKATKRQAERLGIPLITLDHQPSLDLTIDGADELDRQLRLIKGGGGALLREKIVAMASDEMIVIADDSKLVDQLGAFPLPLEVDPFGLQSTLKRVEDLCREAGCEGPVTVRREGTGKLFLTDGGHVILDCALRRIADPEVLSEILTLVPGVVETGLFLKIADRAILSGPEGVRIIEVGHL